MIMEGIVLAGVDLAWFQTKYKCSAMMVKAGHCYFWGDRKNVDKRAFTTAKLKGLVVGGRKCIDLCLSELKENVSR